MQKAKLESKSKVKNSLIRFDRIMSLQERKTFYLTFLLRPIQTFAQKLFKLHDFIISVRTYG